VFNNKKILVIIPARGNSFELKNKNLKKFIKKPLIQWTIDQVRKCKFIDKAIVSSDSERILRIAKKNNFISLSKRPKKLSTSKANIFNLIKYEIKKNPGYDILILLQPTSPLRTAFDIKRCLKLMLKYKRNSCVSFIELKYKPDLMFEISKKKKLKEFTKITKVSNRQDSGKYFYPSGDIYISLISNLLKKKFFLEKNTFPYIMKKSNTIDIDDIYDFMLGQIKFKISKKKNG